MQLSFALYGAANRVARLHKPFLEPLGLTFPQYLVMLELFSSTPRFVGELGAKLDMDTGTITPLLKRLEVAGMVTRTRNPADERRVCINLTKAGEALRSEVWDITDKIKTACQLTDDGLAELRNTLDAFARPLVTERGAQQPNKDLLMKIGIIGAGNIGATIARKLAASGHDVKLANSRGPETIHDLARDLGAVAVSKEQAVKDVEVVVLSLPFAKYPDLASLFSNVPPEVVVIDTSNYYPFRDGAINEIDNGKPESVWVSEQIGRPVIKAWNAVLSHTLSETGKPEGAPGRIAIPVAGDDAEAKATAMQLVGTTGFDALDAGTLAESWRQQPGTPAYCTELTQKELQSALASADKQRAPQYREALIKEFIAGNGKITHDEMVARNRAVTVM